MKAVSYYKKISMWIDSISVAKKLSAGFSVTTILTLGVGIYSIFELKHEAVLIDKMFNHSYTVSNALNDIHVNVQSIEIALQSMIIYRENISLN